ncbi:MAG: polysaccharide export protein EpsE [Betaproteobacteria bacterium]
MTASLRTSRAGRHSGAVATLAAVLSLLVAGAQAATVPAAAPAPAVVAAPVPEQYRIGPGDTLHITVYQSPDLSLDARVNEAGVISYPLIGRVALGGLTVNAAEAHLAQALKKGEIVKDPQVIIVVTNVRANQVNVLGQVGHPGRFPLDLAGMRLTEVVSLAGGIIAGAGSDTIVLIGTRDGHAYRKEADLPRIFAPGGSSDDIVVMPGDTIWVDRAPTIYLYGEIQHAGVQRLERGMTVMQAVAAGGGATPRGTLKGLKVSRRGPDGRIQTIEPSMEDTLKDGDVMYIRESLF